MEWGTYSVNSQTRKLTASITFDGNFDTGLTDLISGGIDIFAQVNGNTLTLQFDDNENGAIDEDESLDFQRK
jgi:regulator of sigma D